MMKTILTSTLVVVVGLMLSVSSASAVDISYTFDADAALGPYAGTYEGPYAEAAQKAMHFGFGKKAAFVREGGSIGAVVTMQKHLRAPIMFLGLSLPEHGYHAPNENFDWGQASGGMKMFVSYFDAVSRL